MQISKSRSPKNTYGWVRAEVLGALVNSVFLLALCFAIVVEAIQRLTTGELKVNDPDTLLYVGIVGLLFNLIALALFHRAGHGHSHGSSGKSHSPQLVNRAPGRPDTGNVEDGEYSHLIPPHQRTPTNIGIRLISPETTDRELHLCR